MSNLNSLLFITSDSTSSMALAPLLAQCRRPMDLSATAVSLHEGLKRLRSDSPPQVVILEVQSIAQGIRDVSDIFAASPETLIMATSSEKRPNWIVTLIRAGIDEYLTTPTTLAELEDALERADLMFDQKQGAAEAGGKIVTVYNPTGGIGTTTIAVNLATALAGRGKMTALADLNPFSSDIAAFLDLTPAYTLSSLQLPEKRISANHLMNIMTRHTSGMHVLCGNDEIDVSSEVTPDQIRSLITLMRGQFSLTFIDAGGSLSPRNLETFNGSDLIIYPLLLTLPALNNAKRYLKSLEFHGHGLDRIKVVVNRYFPRDEIKVADAEKILEVKIFQTIPNSYVEIKKSIYKGTPMVTGYPRSPVTRALTDLAGRVVAELFRGSH
jgi:pilus assembly protein CpaE